jgi:hypothetical protein
MGEVAMDTQLDIFDLGDAMDETRQVSPNGNAFDTVFGIGWNGY